MLRCFPQQAGTSVFACLIGLQDGTYMPKRLEVETLISKALQDTKDERMLHRITRGAWPELGPRRNVRTDN